MISQKGATEVSLTNLIQIQPLFATAATGETRVEVIGRRVEVVLEPGAGRAIRLGTKRYCPPPPSRWPW